MLRPFFCSALYCLATPGLIDPAPGVAKYPHPWTVFLPTVRIPGVLNGPKHALGMWHDNGEASIRRSKAADAFWRAIRIQRIALGCFAAIVDEAQRGQVTRHRQLIVVAELGKPLAMRNGDRHAAARHTLEEQRWTTRHFNHRDPCLELFGPIAHEMRPVFSPGNKLMQVAHHLASVANAECK